MSEASLGAEPSAQLQPEEELLPPPPEGLVPPLPLFPPVADEPPELPTTPPEAEDPPEAETALPPEPELFRGGSSVGQAANTTFAFPGNGFGLSAD